MSDSYITINILFHIVLSTVTFLAKEDFLTGCKMKFLQKINILVQDIMPVYMEIGQMGFSRSHINQSDGNWSNDKESHGNISSQTHDMHE